jgi:hypothetical protein
VLPGVTYSTPVELFDVFRTLEVDGRSLAPLIRTIGVKATWPKHPAITTNGRNAHSLSFTDVKYTRYGDGSEELYNITADPYCWTNLADAPAMADVKAACASFLSTTNHPNVCCGRSKIVERKSVFNYDRVDMDTFKTQF